MHCAQCMQVIIDLKTNPLRILFLYGIELKFTEPITSDPPILFTYVS